MKLGLVGAAVAHSLSPRLHAEALRGAGLQGTYATITASDRTQFEAVVDRLRGGQWLGLNVTAPWKQVAAGLCDELLHLRMRRREVAPSSVNTLWLRQGQLVGASTDGSGLVGALHMAGVPLAGAQVVLLGSGGAAWAVAPALLEAGATQLVVVARREEASAELAAWLTRHFGAGAAVPSRWNSARGLGGADLVIHATSLGHGGSDPGDVLGWLPWSSWRRRGACLADLVYAPLDSATWFERLACGRGVASDQRVLAPRCTSPDPSPLPSDPRGLVRGLGAAMLACQAADSFTLWTGQHPDPWRLLAALRRDGQERH